MSHVQVVNYGKDEESRVEDVFQIDESVDLYWVSPSTKLEENSHFHVTGNTYIHVDIEKLNNIYWVPMDIHILIKMKRSNNFSSTMKMMMYIKIIGIQIKHGIWTKYYCTIKIFIVI